MKQVFPRLYIPTGADTLYRSFDANKPIKDIEEARSSENQLSSIEVHTRTTL